MIRISTLFLTSLFCVSTIAPAFADTLIVGNKREHTISFIDLASGAEIRRVPTGKAPHEVAISPDGEMAVVVSYRERNYLGNSLYVYNIRTGEEVRVIDLGDYTAPHGLKWIGNSRSVAVTTEGSKHLVVADVDTGEIEAAISTGQSGSHMVVLSPDARRAYVANIQSGTFTAIKLDQVERLKNVKAGQGTEAIAITPDGKELWVGNNNSRNIVIFDPDSFEKRGTIDTEGIPIRVEISPNGRFAAVSEADKHRVSIIDVTSREIIAKIDITEVDANVPVTLLFSNDGTRLWAAATRSSKVVEIDTSDWSITRALSAGDGSDGLGYSPISLRDTSSEAPADPTE